MKKAPPLSSKYAEQIANYISFMKNSGRLFRVESTILFAFDRFIGTRIISNNNISDFAYSVQNLTNLQYAKRHRIVKTFTDFLFFSGKSSERIGKLNLSFEAKRCVAYIYSSEEMWSILQESQSLFAAYPLRQQTYYTLFGLLMSSGLRVSEAIHLDISDIDEQNCMLKIRCTKFRKSRLVPIDKSTMAVVLQYLPARKTLSVNTSALFLNKYKKSITYANVNLTFRTIIAKLGIQPSADKNVRIHDLRHTFAVKRISKWYDEGEDVQSKLPLLSTYLGHSKIEDTAYYLSAGTELLAKGAKLFVKEGVL